MFKGEFLAVAFDEYSFAFFNVTAQQRLSEWIFNVVFDGTTQRWPVRVTLVSGEVEDLPLEADCLACTGCVMVREDDGSVRAVPAFASGWLTAQRPGAHVMRLREEDVKGVGVEGLLAAVTDDLADVAAAVALLASSEAGYVTGTTLHVNGGMYMSGG